MGLRRTMSEIPATAKRNAIFWLSQGISPRRLALLGELQTIDRAPLLAVAQDVLRQPASGAAAVESLRRSAARALLGVPVRTR